MGLHLLRAPIRLARRMVLLHWSPPRCLRSLRQRHGNIVRCPVHHLILSSNLTKNQNVRRGPQTRHPSPPRHHRRRPPKYVRRPSIPPPNCIRPPRHLNASTDRFRPTRSNNHSVRDWKLSRCFLPSHPPPRPRHYLRHLLRHCHIPVYLGFCA